jgi:hypothetical protein
MFVAGSTVPNLMVRRLFVSWKPTIVGSFPTPRYKRVYSKTHGSHSAR